MPFGNSGIRVIDFIRSIQKKFNLIIYPDKQNPKQFVIETFNNWYKQGKIKDFNRYINLEDKIEFIPANQLAYRQIKYSDAQDTDYVTTLFKRANNRTYGESNFYDSGSFFSQGKLEVLSDIIGNGPIQQVPGSITSGSAANATCFTYQFTYNGIYSSATASFVTCAGTSGSVVLSRTNNNHVACIQSFGGLTGLGSDLVTVTNLGDCTPPSSTGSSEFPVFIPNFISDSNFRPARVLPRLFFYNGLVEAPPYYISGYNLPFSTSSAVSLQYTEYPYFDVYSTGSLNGTASQFPQLDSLSLLYNNEQAVYGTTPTGSLVSEYWATYLSLLYNPRTRLVNATAVIPLADYFDLELNDIAEFRGNYYHLRAINDYNLTTGEANIQMLGPIIPDTIAAVLSGSWAPIVNECEFEFTVTSGSVPTTTTTSTTTSTTTAPTTTTSTTTSTTTEPTTTTTSTTTSTTTTPPTTTTSTTTTTTTLAFYTYRIYNSSSGYGNAADACTNQPTDGFVDHYAAESTLATVTRFYSDTNLITPFVGGDQFYAFTADGTTTPVNRAQINNGGFLSNNASC
jgi:hypothetical protein